MANYSNLVPRSNLERNHSPPALRGAVESLVEMKTTQYLAILDLQRQWAGQDKTVGHTICPLALTSPFLHTTLQSGSTHPAATIGEMVAIAANHADVTLGINAIIAILVKSTMLGIRGTRDRAQRMNVLSETVTTIDAPTITIEEVSHPADLEGPIRREAETQETVVRAIDRKKEHRHRQLRKPHRQNRSSP